MRKTAKTSQPANFKGYTGTDNKGEKLRVEPIRKKAEVAAVSAHLTKTPKYHALWKLACNNGLRMGDILALTCGQLRHGLADYNKNADSPELKKRRGLVEVQEQKTGKHNVLCIGRNTAEALELYFETYPDRPDTAPAFFSQKDHSKALTVKHTGDLIRSWTKAAKVAKRHYGCHTPRKTWGWNAYRDGVALAVIMKRYKHSDPAITLVYIGADEEEVLDTLACSEVA